jgi:hypothetical protein
VNHKYINIFRTVGWKACRGKLFVSLAGKFPEVMWGNYKNPRKICLISVDAAYSRYLELDSSPYTEDFSA